MVWCNRVTYHCQCSGDTIVIWYLHDHHSEDTRSFFNCITRYKTVVSQLITHWGFQSCICLHFYWTVYTTVLHYHTVVMILSNITLNWRQSIWNHGQQLIWMLFQFQKLFVEHHSNQEWPGGAVNGDLVQENWLPEFSNIQVWWATLPHKYSCPMASLVNSGQSGLWSCYGLLLTCFMTTITNLALLASLIARFMGPTWDPLGLTGPWWVPCGPHENCYLGYYWFNP